MNAVALARTGAAKNGRAIFHPHVFRTGKRIDTTQSVQVIIAPAGPDGRPPPDIEVVLRYKTRDADSVARILGFTDKKAALLLRLTRKKLITLPQWEKMKKVIARESTLLVGRSQLSKELAELSKRETELLEDESLLSADESKSLIDKAGDLAVRVPTIKDRLAGCDRLLAEVQKRKELQRMVLQSLGENIHWRGTLQLRQKWEALKRSTADDGMSIQAMVAACAAYGALDHRLPRAVNKLAVEMIVNDLVRELENVLEVKTSDSPGGVQLQGLPGQPPAYQSGPAGVFAGVMTQPVELTS
jgi:hypothetical protein